jgi:hypothetical protein
MLIQLNEDCDMIGAIGGRGRRNKEHDPLKRPFSKDSISGRKMQPTPAQGSRVKSGSLYSGCVLA